VKIIIKIITLLGILFFCTILFNSPTNAASTDDSCERLILSVLTPNINVQIEDYYRDKLIYPPTFASYLGGNILKFKYFDSHIDAVVTVIPYVGPHIAVGKDKIKFRISNTEQIIVESYEHITDYKLSPNWIHIKR